MESTAIVPAVPAASEMFMPVMDMRQAKARRDAIVGYVQSLMIEGQDYGKIPGTDKPTLLKPGAEKLTTFFGLTPVFVAENIVENFGDDGTEPLFFYRYRCELYRSGVLLGSGIGSCNSRESKYRYRNADRVCPTCGATAIIRGKAEYGGGWICFGKKGGCGAKFRAGDPSIETQATGKITNPDVADLVNTIDKMAQKRAFISAVLISINASEFFTQDLEDITDAAWQPDQTPPTQQPRTPAQSTVAPARTSRPAPTQLRTQPVAPAPEPPADNPFEEAPAEKAPVEVATGDLITDNQRRHLHAVGSQLYMNGWDNKRHELVGALTKGRTVSSAELTRDEAQRLIDGIARKLEATLAAEKAPTVAELEAVPELAH